MRTTVNIDEHLLAEVKLIAARSHRTVGSVLEDALRKMIADHGAEPAGRKHRHVLPSFGGGGLQPGVDLEDREAMNAAMGDDEPYTLR